MKEKYSKYQKQYKILFVEDSLSANVPHIKQLEGNKYSYILDVKPIAWLFEINIKPGSS